MRPGVARSGSPMPSEITSTPARFFSCTLRSISAKRYGGMRPSRLAPAEVLLMEIFEDTRHRIGLDLEPPHPLVAPPPAQLLTCVAPVRRRHRMRQLLERELAADVRERFRVADPAQHRRGCRHAGIQRSLRLGD